MTNTVCDGREKSVHYLPATILPDVKTNDKLAKESALEDYGCSRCEAKKICRPLVQLVKNENGNHMAVIWAGSKRLLHAGIIK